MGTAFTTQEREIIQSRLKEAAKMYTKTIGMRKTTVEELATKAGISKGAFYHFYSTKEHLFFEILEDWHEDMLKVAINTIRQNAHLSIPKRIERTLFCVIESLEQDNMLSFIENDMEILLRKIPREILNEHYKEDSILIKVVLEEVKAKPRVPIEIVSGLMHSVFYTMAHRQEFGIHYQEVLKVLVESICLNIFKE